MSDEVARAARLVSFWDAVETWAFLVVVVALAVEFAAHKLVQAPRDIVENAREAESTQLRKDTAEANAKALATELELARLKAPRVFAADKMPAFVEAMRPFAGQQFSGLIAGNMPDAPALIAAISNELMRAGWKREKAGLIHMEDPPIGITLTPHEGVMVWAPMKREPSADRAGAALAAALQAAGVVARFDVDDNPLNPPNVLVVEIGLKPQ